MNISQICPSVRLLSIFVVSLFPIFYSDGCSYTRGVSNLLYMDANQSDDAFGMTRQTTIGLLSSIEGFQIRIDSIDD